MAWFGASWRITRSRYSSIVAQNALESSARPRRRSVFGADILSTHERSGSGAGDTALKLLELREFVAATSCALGRRRKQLRGAVARSRNCPSHARRIKGYPAVASDPPVGPRDSPIAPCTPVRIRVPPPDPPCRSRPRARSLAESPTPGTVPAWIRPDRGGSTVAVSVGKL
jgi:hypothetical protein